MDREINKSNSMFSSLLHHDYSFSCRISSSDFCSSLMELLQAKLENKNLTAEQDNSNLVVLSALIELLELSSNASQPHSFCSQKQNFSDLSTAKLDVSTSMIEETQQENTGRVQCWFTETVKLLRMRNKWILLIMVEDSLTNRCKFSAFLSRKVLARGLKTGFFEVDHILQRLEVHLETSPTLSIPMTVLLKELVSHVLQEKDGIKPTLLWFVQQLILQKLSQRLQNNGSAGDLSEYMLLIQKLVKLGIASLDSEDSSDFLQNLFQEVIFSNTKSVLGAPNGELQNYLCFQFFKVMDTFLSTEWLHPDQNVPNIALEIIKAFQEHALPLLTFIQECDLCKEKSFTGKEKQQRNMVTYNEPHFSSGLLRCVVVVFLKACALSLQKGYMDKDYWWFVQPFLRVFQLTPKQPKDDSSVQQWFVTHFADQDNQWISSLLSLLVIHKHVKKNPPDAEDHVASRSNTKALSWPQEFLWIFSPHKLFLNFVEFVDFDHLVLSDFLISPETSFLPYFITYLHHILEDWITFKSTAVGSAQEKGFLETDSISKSVDNRKSKEGNRIFTDVNSSLQQMTYKTSIDKTGRFETNLKIVSYSDSDTDTDDTTVSSPPSKKSCLDIQMCAKQCQNRSSDCEYLDSSDSEGSAFYSQSSSLQETSKRENRFDRVMGMLIRLRMHIDRLEEKGLFPYRAKALIKLLEACEEKFENGSLEDV